MLNYLNFRRLITPQLTNCTYKETINDEYREMIVDVKYKNTGPIQLLYKEQFTENKKPEFFIFYMVEVNDSCQNVDFNRYLWQKDSNIKRVVSVACDVGNSTVITLSEMQNNEFESKLKDVKRIIVKPDKDKCIEYTLDDETSRTIKVEDVMIAIKDQNISKLFNRLNSYEEPKQKVIKKA